MASPHLRRTLKDKLGSDAGEELAAVTERVDPILAELGELRREVRTFSQQLQAQSDKLDGVVSGLHALDKRIDKSSIRLVMWSAGFWVAAVAAVGALAGVLRR